MQYNDKMFIIESFQGMFFFLMIISIISAAMVFADPVGRDEVFTFGQWAGLALVFAVITYIAMRLHAKYWAQHIREECRREEYMGRF